MDLWPFLQSARAEARALDQAIRAIVKDHSSGRSINHGELLRAEYKRLVWVWKKKERLATELNNTLTKQVKLRLFPYSAMPPHAVFNPV